MKNHARGNNVMSARYKRRHGLNTDSEESERLKRIVGFKFDSLLDKNMSGLKRGKKGK